MSKNKTHKPIAEHPWRKGYSVPSDSNGYAEAARRKKAEKLARILSMCMVTSRMAANVSTTRGKDVWGIAAKLAHVKPPTEQERALIVELLREREKQCQTRK